MTRYVWPGSWGILRVGRVTAVRIPRRHELTHHLGDIRTEHFDQFEHSGEAGGIAALLDDADVSRMHVGPSRELLQRPPTLLAKAAKNRSKACCIPDRGAVNAASRLS